jgi:GDP-L-fucose synthase
MWNAFWREHRFCVTGGAGFLGSHVVRKLHERGAEHVFVPRSCACDLRYAEEAQRLFYEARPDVVIHLAATVGGIGVNIDWPTKFFRDNALMGIHIASEAHCWESSKLVVIGTTCSYPRDAPVPLREEDLWNGYPEETNAPYGLAKRMLLVLCQAYRQQHGLNAIYLIPANLYGPGDNFDAESSHVIPALIRKCIEAKEVGADHMTAWGSGGATRDFLYVEDAAEAIVRATETFNGAEPINIGTGVETSIQTVAHLIADLVGYQGEIEWDLSKPDGQLRRCLDTRRARQAFGWKASTPIEDGLRKTIDFFTTLPESA